MTDKALTKIRDARNTFPEDYDTNVVKADWMSENAETLFYALRVLEAMCGKQDGELKPCPFCGGEAKLITWHKHTEARHIQCTQCQCMTGGAHFQREFAFKDWNTRTSPAEKLVQEFMEGEKQ